MEKILSDLLVWFVGAFGVATVLMVFFTTAFPQHLFEILKKLGYKKKVKDYYVFEREEVKGFPYRENVGSLTPDDWNEWLHEGQFGKEHPKLVELLSCPGCMSVQASIWLGLVIALVTSNFWMWPVAIISWPSAAKVIFKKV